MPIPTPRADEDKDGFLGRCMADPTMNEDFPEQEQRAAICYRAWDNREAEKDMQASKAGQRRWFSTGFMAGGVGAVDAEKHVLHDAVMIRPGEALGHGLWIDKAFCEHIAGMANAQGEKGLKARFGHPNMCSEALGTFLGRWKGLTVDETGKVSGTLFLSSTAAESPRGDLRKYVEELAAKEPQHFGASLVFSRNEEAENEFMLANGYGGETGFRSPDPANTGNLPHARCAELHAADLVDDPAASDGMFAGASGVSLAAQMTEWLDTHPGVLKALNDEPELLNIVTRYADELQPFLTRYNENRAKREALQMPQDTAVCPQCGHEFDYTAEGENHMGSVACPKCGATVSQEHIKTKPASAAAEPAAASASAAAAESAALQARIDALAAQAEADKGTIAQLTGQLAGAVARAETAEAALATVTTARDGLATRLQETETARTAAVAERDEAQRQLRALETGAEPLSAVTAQDEPRKTSGTLMERARKSKS